VIGADSGIGRAVAIAFAREGADVAISFSSEVQDAEETARLVKECRQTAVLLPGDLADKKVCQTTPFPSTLPAGKVRRFGSDTFFGRAAQPAELAPVFVFLASQLASYVTGEVYGVTGGQMPL
jgi:NAD(P)-dependent dehydrogenase (short-subunit alcohol dehydrogenase family)